MGKRGPKPSGKAQSIAERQRRWYLRRKAKAAGLPRPEFDADGNVIGQPPPPPPPAPVVEDEDDDLQSVAVASLAAADPATARRIAELVERGNDRLGLVLVRALAIADRSLRAVLERSEPLPPAEALSLIRPFLAEWSRSAISGKQDAPEPSPKSSTSAKRNGRVLAPKLPGSEAK